MNARLSLCVCVCVCVPARRLCLCYATVRTMTATTMPIGNGDACPGMVAELLLMFVLASIGGNV